MKTKTFLTILCIIILMGMFTVHAVTKSVYEKKIEQRDSIYQQNYLHLYDNLTKNN